MSFIDKLKQKADEFGVADKANQAKDKAAELAEANRDKIGGAVDKAGQMANEKTGGKYADKISKAQGAARQGVDKVAASGSGHQAGARDTAPHDAATPRSVDDAVGADYGKAADDLSNESPVDRAIGADADSVALDPRAEGREGAN